MFFIPSFKEIICTLHLAICAFQTKTTFAFFFFKQDLARNCDLTDVKLSWAQLWHTFMISMLGR